MEIVSLTYGKLFHKFSITFKAVRKKLPSDAPPAKFESIAEISVSRVPFRFCLLPPGSYCSRLIELFHMVPFPPIVLEQVSVCVSLFPRSPDLAPHPCQRLDRTVARSGPRATELRSALRSPDRGLRVGAGGNCGLRVAPCALRLARAPKCAREICA